MNFLLDAGLAKTLNWLRSNRREFALDHAEGGVDTILLLKPFSEFVLTLRVLTLLGYEVSEHIEWAWQELNQGNDLIDILVARPDLADLVALYANFHEFGYRNARLMGLLAHTKSLDSTKSLEMSAWSRISLEYNFERLQLGKVGEEVMNRSWLGRLPEPWVISDAIAYAVTHEVFYLTDFGTKTNSLGKAALMYLKLWLPVWTRCFMEERNCDIVGELLMAAFCVRYLSWTGQPLLWLTKVQLDSGAFSGPTGAGRVLISSECSPERREFLCSYHTTLVGLMTMAMFRVARTSPGATKSESDAHP